MIRKKRFLISLALIGTLGLLIYPCRVLLADYHAGKAAALLSDPAAATGAVLDIDADTMTKYQDAIARLEQAVIYAPSRSIFRKAQADLYIKLGKWSEVMETMNEQLPSGALTKNEALVRAKDRLQVAIALEPLNADYHLALGQFYTAIGGDFSPADREFTSSVLAAPRNAALRYSVAAQYLLAGKKKEAMEQAIVLGAMDESYLLADSFHRTKMLERRPPEYLSFLSGSYLFKALEVTWRATDKNIVSVKKMIPDNEEAHEVLRLFLQWKSVEIERS